MQSLKDLANVLRVLSVEMVAKANSGHPGMPLGASDIATVLFVNHLKFSVNNPHWQNRDRFILSAGHASALLYSLLYVTGYEDCTMSEIKNFRQIHSKTAGHPEYGFLSGIETTTGPLGQGVANGVGMAIAERKLNALFGDDLINYKTYVLCGDGCLMEGVALEALQLAGHLQLSNFVLIYDKNNITIDGSLSISSSIDYVKMFEAFGFNVLECDGHNVTEIDQSLIKAKNSNKPTVIIAETKIGFGSVKEGTSKVHGSPLNTQEIADLKKKLGVDYSTDTIPQSLLNAWREIGRKHENECKNWENLAKTSPRFKLLEQFASKNYMESLQEAISVAKAQFLNAKPQYATRVLSGQVLEELSKLPFVIGGSADLSGSNNTKSQHNQVMQKGSFSGNYIAYGVREHAMAGIMNGLALSGFLPFGGTFLVFSDYMRHAIRLSALMGIRVFYIMTHDSIGLGEDGPTHQPIEHLASLRAIPNLYVFRPCNAIETAECYEVASGLNAPSLFALSRQNLPFLRENSKENLSSKGGYIIHDCDSPEYVIIATGSEVSLAVEVAKKTSKNIRVVSVPCLEIFRKQSAEYKNAVLGNCKRIFIEAGTINSFYGLYREDFDLHFTINTFGHSGKDVDVYKEFGLTVENICKNI